MRSSDDERRHPPGTELRWVESWTYEFWSDDGTLGGWARLALCPNEGRARYHAFLAGPHRQLVAVIDDEVPIPPSGLEIRTTGLWATHICETPFDHWTVGLEAFGLGVDDPAELYGRQFVDSVPLGFDLEWEAVGDPPVVVGPDASYRQPSLVSGEILVGAEQVDFLGHGWREHRWGVESVWDDRSMEVRGRLDDGTWFWAHVVGGDVATAPGWVDGSPATVDAASQTMDGPGLPAGARIVVGGLEIGLDPVGVTPLSLTDVEGRVSRTPRALCRCTVADGRSGLAWVEWTEPRP